MSEDNGHVNYAGMYAGPGECPPESLPTVDEEPSTIDDLVALETSCEEIGVVAVIDNAIDTINDEEIPTEECSQESCEEEELPQVVYADLDDTARLNVRANPDGAVVTQVTNKTALTVLNSDDPNWLFVQFEDGADTVKGYINRQVAGV